MDEYLDWDKQWKKELKENRYYRNKTLKVERIVIKFE